MKKSKLAAILLFLGGLVCFAAAFYLFQKHQNIITELGYYGVTEKYLKGTAMADTLVDFKFGIVKYSFLGICAWITGILLFRKR